jgi:pyruvate kinase
MHKRTKIVATVGPASESAAMLRELMRAGVNMFRLNLSYGDAREHQRFVERIRAVESELGWPVAVCADLCGPKIRVRPIEGDRIKLSAGSEIVIQRQPLTGTAERISTTLPELLDIVEVGQRILLADGRLRLEVIDVDRPEECRCRVVVGGVLQSGKGVNLPDTSVPISPLTEKDRRDVEWVAENEIDFVALSFVQRAEDVIELRDMLRQHSCDAHIIAKIEKPKAVEAIDAIVEAADAVMVARGDLGVEMDYFAVPIAQKSITRKCEAAGKPCIIATEMLESMIESSRATRAEVSDVANAVVDRADAVMLSAETSIGKHGVESVAVMRRTVVAAEEFLEEHGQPVRVAVRERPTTTALAGVVRSIMETEPIAAIAVFTASGTSARLIAKNRPPCPIIAFSPDATVVRRTCLYYGVVSRQAPFLRSTAEMLQIALQQSRELCLANRGDRIIVIAGFPAGIEDTNGLLVQTVE